MALSAPGTGACRHASAMSEESFEELFGKDLPVVFFFHGSPSTVRGLIYRRRSSGNRRFSVKGFIEQGSTTSRFDLVIRLLERLAENAGKSVMETQYAPLVMEL